MYKTKNLLSVGNDAKTVKGEALGFLTGILYLLPSDQSGYQVCSMANKLGLSPRVRLNGTSDIRWETVRFTVDGTEYDNIFQMFPDVIFYDYTKDANRSELPSNYDLTFSYSGVDEFQPYVEKALAKGMRMAVVFRKEDQIPATFRGIPVVSGDKSDVRDLDDQGVIVGLYAKGKAVYDTTGFVV